MIIKARKLLNQETLITLYYSFIYPYLQYCNHVWGNACASYLKKLNVLQKRIVRIIGGVKPREHSLPIFRKLNILSIFDINIFVIGCFMYQVHHKKTLKVFSDMFCENSKIHNYSTRQANHFHLPQPKKEIRKSTISYRGAVIWNTICTLGIKTEAKMNAFKENFKKFIMDKICHFN